MRIRMLVQLSGPTMALEPGDECDFPQDEAIRLIKAGFAVPVAESPIERAVIEPVVETRVDAPIETADFGRRRKKRRH